MEGGTTIDVCGHDPNDLGNYHGNINKEETTGYKHDPNGEYKYLPLYSLNCWFIIV